MSHLTGTTQIPLEFGGLSSNLRLSHTLCIQYCRSSRWETYRGGSIDESHIVWEHVAELVSTRLPLWFELLSFSQCLRLPGDYLEKR